MKERPILFSGPMVCAILEGRKTQTRRVVKFQRGFNEKGNVRVSGDMWQVSAGQYNVWSDPFSCPYGVAGDRLWVRETWAPSVRASRLTLEITDVRVERLQSISEDDAKAEGVDEMCVLPGDQGSFIQPYAALWESINPGSWNANPWVWVVEFKQI